MSGPVAPVPAPAGEVRTTCPYCGVGCGVLASPQGVRGDPDHPANRGRLCSKGTALIETVGLEDRLLAPEIDGAPAGWDAAIARIAGAFGDAIREHGPDSVALYVSGQLLTEDYYLANKLAKGGWGTANIDTNSRLCMASSVAGHRRAFGTDTVPQTYDDIEAADLIVAVGSNAAWCHPVLWRRVEAEKARRPGLKVVVVDPRRTATCDVADLHLAIRPDGDVALFNRLLVHLHEVGRLDAGFVRDHVAGFDAALTAAAEGDGECGAGDAEVAAFLDLFTRTERVLTLYSQGVNQSASGTDKVNAILNCHLATGRIGRPGCGPLSLTGQPNAMGGREVGGLANMLGWHLDLENADHRAAVAGAWGVARLPDRPGLKAVDMFEAIHEGRIKALWVMSTNPAVSLPDGDRVRAALDAVPFLAVSDVVRTDTTAFADVILPATAWGEKSGTVTNSDRTISRQRPFLPAPGEARPDWAHLALVARAMGLAGFDQADEAEVFDEYARLSRLSVDAGRDLDLTGLAGLGRAGYDAMAPVRWPVRADGTAGGRFFEGGGFYHGDGRARMIPVAPPPPADRRFTLNTGRIRDQWHTMTRTGRSARLSAHLAEPFLEIHPEDALALGLRPADLARVTSDHGIAILRVLVTPRVAPGQMFAPMHWTAATGKAGRVNTLVAPVTDPVSGQPASKATEVDVAPLAPAFHAFAVSRHPMEPARPYAAIARAETGWRAETAGLKTPVDWEAEARATTRATGTASQVTAGGTIRFAFHDADGLLEALFFASPGPVAVARAQAIALIGTATPATEALAGRAPADRPDPGPQVCACMNVGRNTILATMDAGAASVEAVGAACAAGTSCGSCRPEIAALLASRRIAAE